MTNFTYKAKNGGDFFVPGVGTSTNGTITLNGQLESSALELVDDAQVNGEQVSAASDGAVNGINSNETPEVNQ